MYPDIVEQEAVQGVSHAKTLETQYRVNAIRQCYDVVRVFRRYQKKRLLST